MTDPGDPLTPALERALFRFTATVQRVARGHGLTGHDFDELTQQIRIRLWRALGTSEKIEAVPTSYVYRTALSAAVDIVRGRRSRREEALDEALETVGVIDESHPDPAEAVERRELGEQVAAAIEALSPARRPVVRMHLAGYRLAEIADLLGWSEGKARNLLYRGLADLRARLTGAGVGPDVRKGAV